MKRLMLFIAGICSVAMISCSKDETEKKPVESIIVEKAEITVCTQTAFNPIAFGLKVFPGTLGDLAYSTSDKSIVWLKQEEIIGCSFHTGNKTGVATLTCASEDGKYKAEIRVNVVNIPKYYIKCEKTAPSVSGASDGELKVTISVDNKTNCPIKDVLVEWREKFSSDKDCRKETITDIRDNKFVFEKKGLRECVIECDFRVEFEGLVDMLGHATHFTNDFMMKIPSPFKPEQLAGNWYVSSIDGYRYVDGGRERLLDVFKSNESDRVGFSVFKFEIVDGQVKLTVSTNNADGSKTTDVIEGALQSGDIIETENKEWRVEILSFSEQLIICSLTRTTLDEGLVLHETCELKKFS